MRECFRAIHTTSAFAKATADRHFAQGPVASSRPVRYSKASSRVEWHMASVGRRLTHTAGRSGLPNKAQRRSGSSCTQGIPAGLPCGMPGIGDEMLGAMQHAPQ